MKTYKIKIVETLEKVVEIKAETSKDALQIANNEYRKSTPEYILGADNFNNVYFKVVKND